MMLQEGLKVLQRFLLSTLQIKRLLSPKLKLTHGTMMLRVWPLMKNLQLKQIC
jgi:hypothetical protein